MTLSFLHRIPPKHPRWLTLLGPVAEHTDAFGSLLTIANQAYHKFVSVSDSQEAVIGVVNLMRKKTKPSNNATIERVEGNSDSSEGRNGS